MTEKAKPKTYRQEIFLQQHEGEPTPRQLEKLTPVYIGFAEPAPARFFATFMTVTTARDGGQDAQVHKAEIKGALTVEQAFEAYEATVAEEVQRLRTSIILPG